MCCHQLWRFCSHTPKQPTQHTAHTCSTKHGIQLITKIQLSTTISTSSSGWAPRGRLPQQLFQLSIKVSSSSSSTRLLPCCSAALLPSNTCCCGASLLLLLLCCGWWHVLKYIRVVPGVIQGVAPWLLLLSLPRTMLLLLLVFVLLHFLLLLQQVFKLIILPAALKLLPGLLLPNSLLWLLLLLLNSLLRLLGLLLNTLLLLLLLYPLLLSCLLLLLHLLLFTHQVSHLIHLILPVTALLCWRGCRHLLLMLLMLPAVTLLLLLAGRVALQLCNTEGASCAPLAELLQLRLRQQDLLAGALLLSATLQQQV